MNSKLTRLEAQLLKALEDAQVALSFGVDAGEVDYSRLLKEVTEAINAARDKGACLQCAGSGMIMLGEDVSTAEFTPCGCTED